MKKNQGFLLNGSYDYLKRLVNEKTLEEDGKQAKWERSIFLVVIKLQMYLWTLYFNYWEEKPPPPLSVTLPLSKLWSPGLTAPDSHKEGMGVRESQVLQRIHKN